MSAALDAYRAALDAIGKAEKAGAPVATIAKLGRALNDARAAWHKEEPPAPPPAPPPNAWQPPPPLPRKEQRAGGPWSLVLQEVAAPRHHVDVYLQHDDGHRHPPGPNLVDAAKAEAEGERWLKILDWPAPRKAAGS